MYLQDEAFGNSITVASCSQFNNIQYKTSQYNMCQIFAIWQHNNYYLTSSGINLPASIYKRVAIYK